MVCTGGPEVELSRSNHARVCAGGTGVRAVKRRTKLAIVRSTLRLSMAMLTSILLESDHGKTISLGLSSEGGVEG